MSKRKNYGGGRYNWRSHYNLPNGKFDEAILRQWYDICQPSGSGPLGEMRLICALIEEIAELKGIDLRQQPKEEEDNAILHSN